MKMRHRLLYIYCVAIGMLITLSIACNAKNPPMDSLSLYHGNSLTYGLNAEMAFIEKPMSLNVSAYSKIRENTDRNILGINIGIKLYQTLVKLIDGYAGIGIGGGLDSFGAPGFMMAPSQSANYLYISSKIGLSKAFGSINIYYEVEQTLSAEKEMLNKFGIGML